jgi:tetrahydromethanopterin S-methyltransferase subunit F
MNLSGRRVGSIRGFAVGIVFAVAWAVAAYRLEHEARR